MSVIAPGTSTLTVAPAVETRVMLVLLVQVMTPAVGANEMLNPTA